MRYHIDTIPVWDALKGSTECPLCALRRKVELADTERFLGGSVMESDIRIRVNEKGFCAHHQALLYAQKNRLGHALMMHTHLMEAESKAMPILRQAADGTKTGGETSLLKKLTGRANSRDCLREAADALDALCGRCILCDGIHENMERYTYTFLTLFKTDENFRETFRQSKGVCLPDAALLLRMADEVLSGNPLYDFTDTLAQLTEKSLSRVEDELEWFTQKFDYRNSDKPWNNSRDALERTVGKLRGWCVGAEPNPK